MEADKADVWKEKPFNFIWKLRNSSDKGNIKIDEAEEGEIWPQSSTNITVLFYAFEVGEVVSTAYLEVTGREDRIPLSLYGLGKGPIFRLNVLTIDVNNIYLCSVHNYEIVAANKGHISGTLVYRPKPTDFGGTIKVTPPALTLKPDEYKSFNLSFSSNRKGEFVERVDFVIKESLEVQSVHIKGCIVCPTLHFDKDNLDFGTTALGFSTRQEVCLHNLSLMPVSFSITVPNDGLQPPLTYEEFAEAQTKPSFPTNPREFTISPEEGVVPAHASSKIKITYTANIRRSGRSIVRVDMWDSDSDPVTLPITFCGDVASLLMKPAEIAIRFCFINFPYSRSVTIENRSDLDGYFYLVPQPVSDSTSIVCSVSTYQNFLKARQSKMIDVTTITRILGKQAITLSMLTMGEQSPIISCVITCNGQGPVISAQPTKLDFGEIRVLQEKTLKFLLISDAPIPAQFKATMGKKTSPWSVNPSSGELEPNGSMEIEVKLYLRDSGSNETLQEEWYVFGQIQGQGKRELLGSSIFKATFTEPQILFSKKLLTFRIDMCPNGETVQQTDELFVTNNSRLNLNVQVSIEAPFHLINNKEEILQRMKMTLLDKSTTQIRLNFAPKLDGAARYSQSYCNTLWLEYDEHPNRDKIKCMGSLNFPNLMFSCKDLIINSVLGSSTEKILTLTNNGPIPATYKFLWVEESARIGRSRTDACDTIVDTCSENNLNVREYSGGSQVRIENLSNRQDGSGDGPEETLGPPSNSPASEEFLTQRSKFGAIPESKVNLSMEEADAALIEIRNFLLPMIEKYFVEDTEIPALDAISFEPPTIPLINQILDIVPREGTVLPYSRQHVHFGFHGLEAMRVNAALVCEIARGPTEVVNVSLCADSVQFSVDKEVIDFGQQLLCEYDLAHVVLKNHSSIDFLYKVYACNSEIDTTRDDFEGHSLKVTPYEGSCEPQSSTMLKVEHKAMVLGPFEINFKLQVAHFIPFAIHVKGVATFPQIYLSIRRENIFEVHPTTIGYSAIQALTPEFIIEKVESTSGNKSLVDETNSLAPEDTACLSGDGWVIVVYSDILPTVVDIEMAIERLLAAEFVEKNVYALTKYNPSSKKQAIPYLFTPEYVIDMGHLIIGLTTCYTTTLVNYGPWNAEVKLKKQSKRDFLENQGLMVQFKRQSNLRVNDNTVLHVVCNPTQEVTHGCTVPVTIRGIVTYPYIAVDTKHLDFQEVFVGECSMMCILVENKGFVDCLWEAKLSERRRKQEESPFSLHYDSSTFPHGQTKIVRVYFKPYRKGPAVAKLNLAANMSLESHIVTLTGHGIERELNIIEPTIRFLSVVPFTRIQEEVFTIEAGCRYPVEFFWHHLDSLFIHEDRVAEVLTRYYRTDEILLPPRRLGEHMPQLLIDFYNKLISAMTHAMPMPSFEEPVEQVSLKGSNVHKSTLPNNSEFQSGKLAKNNGPATSILCESNVSDNTLPSSVNNSEKIQQKLRQYIEDLQRKSDFSQEMKDPVADLFDTTETKLASLNDAIDPSKPAKKVCIIFHGAPFTEEKRENVDVREKHKVESPESKSASEKKSSQPTKIRLNPASGDASPRPETILRLHRESDALAEFNKIPDGGRLESMEPLDRYEYKVQAISQLQKILSRYAVDGLSGDKTSLKGSQKSGSRRQNTFLDIDAETLMEVLEERLSKADYSSGFVVQNLKNLFIGDIVASFLFLLRIVGYVEYFLLVTFLNSTEICNRKIEELQELNATKRTAENIERIQDIENMSLSDYDLLSQEDKRSYLEAILPIRKKEALHRRMQFNRRMAEKSNILSPSSQHPKNRKGVKLNKIKSSKPMTEDATKSAGSKRDGSKTEGSSKKAKSKDSYIPSKILEIYDEKEIMTKEIDEIHIAMNEYYTNLSAMEETLRNWDPINKIVNTPLLERNKVPRVAKSRDKTSIDTSREQIFMDKFNIWYVRSTDPWSDISYNMIVSQMNQNQQAKCAIYREVTVEPDLRPKMYSILRPRDSVKQNIQRSNDVFQLISIPTHETRSILTESEQINQFNISSNQEDKRKNRKKRRRTSSNKIDDLKSLNVSTAESKDTDISLEQITEDTVKPRWILQPNEIRKFKVRFQPKKEGVYKQIYRKEIRILTIRNKSSVPVFWCIEAEEPIEQQITFTPIRGIVKTQSQQKVDFSFHATKIGNVRKFGVTFKAFLHEKDDEPIFMETIPVSAETYDVAVDINHANPLNLNCVKVDSPTTACFTITNRGNYEIKYVVTLEEDEKLTKIGPYSLTYIKQNLEVIPACGSVLPQKIETVQIKKRNLAKKGADREMDMVSKKDKASSKTTSIKVDSESADVLEIGSFVITKTENSLEVGQTDAIAIECFPEFVGLQEEKIVVHVPDSVPSDRHGKEITLAVDSCMPSIDFQDLDSMFRENYLIDDIQNFDCPKQIGAHTVFSKNERCLYFRYVSVSSTHVAYFKLHNRNVIPADVNVAFLSESLIPQSAKLDTFAVEPINEQIAPMCDRRFSIAFTPELIATYQGIVEIAVKLPPHLADDKFSVKLVGESCVPEISIIEPPRGKRERAVLNFGRTLVSEDRTKKFGLRNIGVIEAKVMVEICKDPSVSFALISSGVEHTPRICIEDKNTTKERCTVLRLTAGAAAWLEIQFSPKEVGKYTAQIRLLIIGNPYENLAIELEGEGYMELVVLQGLDLVDTKSNVAIGNRNQGGNKIRKTASKQGSLASGSTARILAASLSYTLDYGLCFINKMYNIAFKIVNKSKDRWFRFQWDAHPNVIFIPSVGHLKGMTRKEITATFLSSEPMSYVNSPIECAICEIGVADSSEETAWDDRQTVVQWEEMDSGIGNHRPDVETLARKVVEPAIEPDHQIVPGTAKHIEVLLNAIVAFSQYSCTVNEVNFKDTLMFQKREYSFTLSNPSAVNMVYAWKINMDVQYPIRPIENDLRSKRGNVDKGTSEVTSNSHHKYNRSQKVSQSNEQNTSHLCRPLLASANTIEINPPTYRCPASDLFSSTAGLTERSTDSWLEGDDLPFEISPKDGILPPQGSTECTLKFSPMDVFIYKAYLTCKIENLDPKVAELVISIRGRSLLPYCHFDIAESDYLHKGRRDPQLPGPLGYEIDRSLLLEHTTVIEFKVIGVGGTHVKKFHMINPTADDYHFTWKDRTRRPDDEVPNFHCTIPEGIAERGKRTELSFTFLAEDVGVKVRDAITMVNNEEFSISFRISEDSLYSEGRAQRLIVTPMHGVMKPRSEEMLCVEYYPSLPGEFHFVLQTTVKTMKKPFATSIATTAYEITPFVKYIDPKKQIIKICQDKENVINLGNITLREPVNIEFNITNSGKIAFYYTWDLGMTTEIVSKNFYAITMLQKEGHVTSESGSTCYLTVTAFQKVAIKDHPVILKISRGPIYNFILKAAVKIPSIKFSFKEHNFGACYIEENGAPAYQTELLISNFQDTPFILEGKFEEQPHMSVNLDSIAKALPAHSSVKVPISFTPLRETQYRETICFLINSTVEKKITIAGEGISYKIRLANPRDKSIDLGTLPANKTYTRKIPVINEGRAPVNLQFDLAKSLPGYEQHWKQTRLCVSSRVTEETGRPMVRASISETKRSGTQDVTLQTNEPDLTEVLKIEPSGLITMPPGGRKNLVVLFRPTCRMKRFTAKVALQIRSRVLPLFIVHGACAGAEFRLDRMYVSFGAIVEGCTSKARVLLSNTGDVGARFGWNTSKLPGDFSIAPISGYCSSGTDVRFVVKFEPSREQSLIEGHASLDIEQYGPLNLKITGRCSKLPEPVETISFTSNVRERQTKHVNIVNDTVLPWELKPEVTGDYFASEKILHIPSKNSVTCAITYMPMVINKDRSPHLGTLFLKLPNDKVPILYSLRGLALPSQAIEKIARQIPAKTKYAESFVVYNWLSKPQRFQCSIERLTNTTDQKKDVPLFSFNGTSKIDVPANGQRNYRAVFHSYKEFVFQFKVMFTNEEDEYQFYEVHYTVAEPEVIESIKLHTAARSSACHVLRLENPLEDQSITYTAQCRHPHVVIRDTPKLVPPLCIENIAIDYCPLLSSEEVRVMLDIDCRELGHFPYELRLKAISAPPEKVIRMHATFGSFSKFSLPISNHTKKNAQFIIEVDNNAFTCPKSVEIPANEEGVVNVIYEPCDVENVTCTLIALSSTAGQFIYPIIGTYSLPKPQGPYTVTAKTPAAISFKNVFNDRKNFEFIVDDPNVFAIEVPTTSIVQKQTISVKVNLQSDMFKEGEIMADKHPVTGKLIVCCTNREDSNLSWIYYLRGILE
ncbi:hypothetical protein KM043_017763 [Ampulex compressa]|nr:hypothetical protein KM043_017763 [Ampulex compressa]